MLKNHRVWLSALLVWVGIYQGLIAYSALDDLRHGESKPTVPLQLGVRLQIISGVSDEAREAGVRYGDVLQTVDGQPFSNMSVLYEAVLRRKPGDLLPITVLSPKGTPFSVSVRIPPSRAAPAVTLDWIGQILLALGLPVFCLSLGFSVAFMRPSDRIAWLLLALMIGFAGLAQDFPVWDWPGWWIALVWSSVLASRFGLWTLWLLFFAILFPTPLRLDRKFPWLKWLFGIPLILNSALLTLWIVGRQFSFSAIEFLRRPLTLILLFRTDLLFSALVVLIFFIVIGLKSLRSDTIDGQRRLRILFLGSLLSLGPVLVQVVRSVVVKRAELLSDAGALEYFVTLLPLLLFPLTLVYAIVIRRAMDVRATLRQLIQYTLEQRGFTILQIAVTAMIIVAIAFLSSDKTMSRAVRMQLIALGFLIIIILRPTAEWLTQWIDRRFFREAYNNEQNLKELALSLRTLMEEKTLIQTLTLRISDVLHVPRVAFLLNRNGAFTPVYSTGYQANPTLVLAENGGIVRHLKIWQKAAPIYFDDPNNWIQTVHPDEQTTLKKYQTEVFLPLAVKDKLLGVVALGPRQSEAPYNERDLALLDAVATQAGFALQNSRLADEIATRPKLSSNTI